eukprot:511322-Lingulodinium_polyedra.AAC.1
MPPLAWILSVAKAADAVADITAVRREQETARHCPSGNHRNHELAALRCLRTLHGPRPTAASIAGD